VIIDVGSHFAVHSMCELYCSISCWIVKLPVVIQECYINYEPVQS